MYLKFLIIILKFLGKESSLFKNKIYYNIEGRYCGANKKKGDKI